ERIVQFVSDAGKKRTKHRHLFALIERLALADHFLLGTLSVSNVTERPNEPNRISICVDDQTAQTEPAWGIDGLTHADFKLKSAALPSELSYEVLLQRRNVLRLDHTKQFRDRLSECVVFDSKDLVQSWRKIRVIRDDIPVQQAYVRTACGQRITFLAFPQPRLGCLQIRDIVNRADNTHTPPGFVAESLCPFVHNADIAVRALNP